jgi:hypothetical protein
MWPWRDLHFKDSCPLARDVEHWGISNIVPNILRQEKSIFTSFFIDLSPQLVLNIAGHRHRGRCRRHRHFGILYLSPVPDYSGSGLGPLIPVSDWFRHPHFCSFRYRTEKGVHTARAYGNGYTLHVLTAVGGKNYTLHVHRQLLMVLFLLYDIRKSYINAGMPEQS